MQALIKKVENQLKKEKKMTNTHEESSIEVLFVEHFKTEEDAKAHADELLNLGFACSFFTSPLGYFVCALEIELSA